MAKDFAKVNIDLWADPDFKGLPPAAQHLYLLLWTSPGLSYCGVHDWRPGRLAARSRGFDASHIRTVSDCLQARHFLVVDEETEEVLVRSWARFDEVMKHPKLAVSLVNAYAEVESQTLSQVLVHEVKRIQKEAPELRCWTDKRVVQMLAHPSVSAKDLPTPTDPFGASFGEGLGLGLPQGLPIGFGETRPKVYPRVSPPPTTATATTTTTLNIGDDDSPSPEQSRLDVERLCVRLADRIEGNGAKRPSVSKRWRDSARLLLDRDGHTEAQIAWIIDWATADEFWRSNILSMPTLREKFDQLVLKARPHVVPARTANGQPILPPLPTDDLR